jgi:hypothetical protein
LTDETYEALAARLSLLNGAAAAVPMLAALETFYPDPATRLAKLRETLTFEEARSSRSRPRVQKL